MFRSPGDIEISAPKRIEGGQGQAPAYPAPLFAVGLISAAALAYEILLTRVFAIVHWHHLVATAISLALLGYGASGTFLAITGHRLQSHFAAAFIGNALLFSISSLACVEIAQRLPFDPQGLTWDGLQLLYLTATFLILAIPFFAAANCIGLALWHFKTEIPRLYGFDLIGAGVGALLLIISLEILSPADSLFGVYLVGILVSALAAVVMRWHARTVAIAGLLLATGAWFWASPAIHPAAYKDLARSLSVIGASLEQEVSGIAGTVSVVGNDRVPLRLAPGLSLNTSALPPRQLAVFVDGDAAGALNTVADGTTASRYLHDLTSALPYALLDAPRVAILNAGVGLGVQQALSLGATSVTAVEPNPLLHRITCQTYAALSGELCDPSRVNWQIQAPRTFLAADSGLFDLISLSVGVDPAGLNALAANYDLTREAVRHYLAHLAPGGWLAIEGATRIPPRLSLRAIDTLRVGLAERGIMTPARHIAMIRGWQRFVLLASNEPLDDADQAAIRSFAASRGFDLVWLPGMQASEANRYQQLSTPQYYLGAAAMLTDTGATVAHAGDRFLLQAASDDIPFPNRFTRWQEFWRAVSHGDRGQLAQIDTGLLVGAITLALAGAVGIMLILFPLLWIRRESPSSVTFGIRIRTLLYFGLIGIAFLFMEIAWIQRLQLFLGHPVYATTAVLAGFLVFAGLGSLMAQKNAAGRARRPLIAAVLAIALFSLVYLVFLTGWLDALSGLPVAGRMGIVLLLMAPLAFAMGIPFPVGLRGLGQDSSQLIPWAWGINGVASVISAAATPLLAMEIGFSGLVMVAVAAYVLIPAVRPGR